MSNGTDLVICANCQTPKAGKFCGSCGQKEDHRYNLHLLWHDVVHAVTHADKGIFSYALQVLYKPGLIAADLIAGKRKRYFNPFQFLLIMLGFYVLVLTSTNFMSKLIAEMGTSGTNLPAQFEKINMFLSKYQKFIYLLLIPVSALVVKWIFPKSPLNYSEHLIGYVVYYSNSMLTHTIIMLLTLGVPQTEGMMMTISSVLTFGFMGVYFRQLYKVSWLAALLKAALYMIIFIAMVAIGSIFVGILIGL
ncbi:MAG: DUF3667 domain-containing protein [Chitinophagaceae bacterium]|nr:MAG: DUF3667 domain-containing protein [Chitinophagaceae bacterium]